MREPLQGARTRDPAGESAPRAKARGRAGRRGLRAAALLLCALAGRSVRADDPVVLENPAQVEDTIEAPAAALPGATRGRADSLLPRLVRAPLDPPLTINGGFGEYRAGHFHAGVDLGTGGRVGKPVLAPLAGSIVRVRTSGVGYGRSLYLEARDGRLLQFGHLDAFAEPVASYIAAVQESSGQYDQDLWPEPRRFPVRAGDVIAWTGESGAGGPHLHFEVRRGDTAYNPFRAGIRARDDTAPTIASLTLEPLDDASFVERCAAPHTIRFGAARETLLVEGRVRAVVGAHDGAGPRAGRIVPWSVAIEFEGRVVECRFDSLSWATDMAEGDYVFDAGRIVGGRGLVMWAPAGFRPRIFVSDVPRAQEAGTIAVRAGDAPRRLRIVARDVAGNRTVRTVVLRAPSAGERGPDPARAGGRATPVAERARFEFASLPSGMWRMTYRGAPAGSREVAAASGFDQGALVAMSTDGRDWVALLPADAWAGAWQLRGRDAGGAPWSVPVPALAFDEPPAADAASASGSTGPAGAAGFRWSLPRDARFEPGAIGRLPDPASEPAPPELAPIATVGRLEPASLALRRPVRVVQSLAGVADTARVGLYRLDPDGWSHLGAKRSADGSAIEADSRRLGTFALFADTLAPRIARLAPPRAASAGRYSRWALEARLAEEGSGVDGRASGFEVDGVRVPSEWDAEERTLRWRPHHPPPAGEHRYTVVVADRAGNVARSSGSFVLD